MLQPEPRNLIIMSAKDVIGFSPGVPIHSRTIGACVCLIEFGSHEPRKEQSCYAGTERVPRLLRDFLPRRNLAGTQECPLNHCPSGTSGSLSSQRASNPSWDVEISRSRTRLIQCAINAAGIRSRSMRGITQRP